MSWQLASFAVLALALAAGFAWYERARPSAKLLALVATLAALAALGRVAFAPLPSVKPTTDIVLLVGLRARRRARLRRRRGRRAGLERLLRAGAVHAVADGRLGRSSASSARCSRASSAASSAAGRWPAPARSPASPTASFLDLHLWVLYSAHTLGGVPARRRARRAVQPRPRGRQRRLLPRLRPAARARAGPLPRPPRGRLASAARRRAARPPALGAVLAALAVALGARRSRADGARRRSRADAGDRLPRARAERRRRLRRRPRPRLRPALHELGGHRASPPAGRDPRTVKRGGRSGVDYIVRNIGRVRGIGDVERAILALRAGRPLAALGRRPQPRRRAARASAGATARSPGLVNQTAFAILALRAGGRPRSRPHGPRGGGLARGPAQPRRRLQLRRPRRARAASTTPPRRCRALVAAGKRAHAAPCARAAAFLAARQNADGGLPLTPGGASNAQSTAWAIQALVAAGPRPRPRAPPRRALAAGLPALAAGARRARSATRGRARQTPVWVTAQALTGARAQAVPDPVTGDATAGFG